MPTPFPGMDPYLERPGLWEEVHTRLIVAIADEIGRQVRPRYRVSVERRTYVAVTDPDEWGSTDSLRLSGKPDILVVSPSGTSTGEKITETEPSQAIAPQLVALPMPEEVVERYLVVRDVTEGDAVTVIEILSPSNKVTAKGREQYLQKRNEILGSAINLIEIDLLRVGQPFPYHHQSLEKTDSHYRILVSRALQRPLADLYSFTIRDTLPDIPLPLKPNEVEPILMLTQVLHDLYDRADYDLVIDYQQPAVPPLKKSEAQWVEQLLKKPREV